MKSKITGGPTEIAFSTRVLNKYNVTYYRCTETGFIQTEEPYWLDEAYSSAITKLDIGILMRNEVNRTKTARIISSIFDSNKSYLDYAGGYGMFTRMMRDQGYDFYHEDIYCKNIFAEYFDISDCKEKNNFELVTAFEVFEHLSDPKAEIAKMMAYGNNLLFSTELQPEGMTDVSSWWYIIPETGQHVALYTKKSLEVLAGEMGLNFYTDGVNLHLFTRNKPSKDPFKENKASYLMRNMKRALGVLERLQYPRKESLLMKDFSLIKENLNKTVPEAVTNAG